MPDNSIDAVVTDPPYALVSIVKRFGAPGAAPSRDGDVYSRASSGFMGQTWDTGEIAFNVLFWREVLRVLKPGGHILAFSHSRTYHRLAVAIEDAGFEIRDSIMWLYGSGFPKSHNQPGGWGTALKPAHEPIVMARKPLIGTVAANLAAYGTGALNIDACRVGAEVRYNPAASNKDGQVYKLGIANRPDAVGRITEGRWPANVIHDGSDEVIEAMPARFFYCAKASKADRNSGLDGRSTHPTVKPTDLMRYLCRLITPQNGVIYDPFMGSGSTGKAAILEGFHFEGVDQSEEYFQIARQRIEHAGGTIICPTT